MISSWSSFFDSISTKDYCKRLHAFLEKEYAEYLCFPPRKLMFNAFAMTEPQTVKAVIIGQDPYHNDGQAMGLSFSVPQGMPLPPSLQNIYKEIQDDLGIPMNFHNGDLTPWAKQGVLMLNARLSVRAHEPLSHSIPEYDDFMEDVMRYLDGLNQPIVFLLWGSFARKFKEKVTNPKHFVLESAHPSPMAANRGGWFGMHQFSRCNQLLQNGGVAPIDWQIR